MEKLEVELGKIKKSIEENPDLYASRDAFNLSRTTRSGGKIHRALKAFANLAEKYEVDKNVCRLVFTCLYYPRGPFRIRDDKSIQVYTPSQLFKRLRGIHVIREPIGAEKISKRLGFTGFDLKAKNFVANVYKLFYDAYLKDYVEKERERRAPMKELLFMRR